MSLALFRRLSTSTHEEILIRAFQWRRMLVQQPPLKDVDNLVTMDPNQRILLCESRSPDSYMAAGNFLPSYIRMPDILALALAPMDISFAELPEGPVAVRFRVLWYRYPPRVSNRVTADLIEKMVSDFGVVVENIGSVRPSLLLKSVSTLRKILLRDPDRIYATDGPIS